MADLGEELVEGVGLGVGSRARGDFGFLEGVEVDDVLGVELHPILPSLPPLPLRLLQTLDFILPGPRSLLWKQHWVSCKSFF